MIIPVLYTVTVAAEQASGYGAGTLADPVRILPGGAGLLQATAYRDMIAAWQGQVPTVSSTQPGGAAGRGRRGVRSRSSVINGQEGQR